MSTLLGARANRSSRTGDRTATSLQPQIDLEHRATDDLDVGEPVHGDEGVGQSEPGFAANHRGRPAARVGVEAVPHHRQLGFVGMARHHAGVALGDQAGRLGPGRGIVGRRIGPGADRCLPQGPVDPQQSGHGGHRRHDHDDGHDKAETQQPPLGMVMEESVDAGEEGKEPQEEDGHEGNGYQPDLPDDLAVEEPRPDEVGDVPVQPLHTLEKRTRASVGLRARAAGRGRHGGQRACRPATRGPRRCCKDQTGCRGRPVPAGPRGRYPPEGCRPGRMTRRAGADGERRHWRRPMPAVRRGCRTGRPRDGRPRRRSGRSPR